MVRISEEYVNVVGDSLESCLYARYLAETKPKIKRIDHYTTGEYGGFYFDEVKDSSYIPLFLTRPQLLKINKFIPNFEVKLISENHVKVPAKKIKFTTPYDEYITYPINRGCFELDMDYKDAILRNFTYEEFIAEYKDSKNITRLMKTVFSDNFYLNIIKKIGCNQWNTNQSQIDPGALYHMLHLEQIDSKDSFEYYYPVNGMSDLCKQLLDHPKIAKHTATRKNIKATFKAQEDRTVYLFEYIDYYMDFMFGGFDYMKCNTEIHTKSFSEQNYFRIYTPFDKTYYVYFGIGQTSYKSQNIPYLITANDFCRSILVPTMTNYRRLNEYRKVAQVSRNLKIMI